MIDYENMIIERERSEFPTGLKHYAKDTIIENNLFEGDLIQYKLKGILKGEDYEQKDEREVCQGAGK